MPPTVVPSHLGRYQIVRPLAAGGMARVYLARLSGPQGFHRHLALKVLYPDPEADLASFRHESRLIAQLHHQHIAQVFDVGVTPDGTSYLVMEYVFGVSLKDVLESARRVGRRLPLPFGMSVVAAAAAGLHHAHERVGADGPLGIVHRDVSPSNLMIGHDGSVKLIDFGIALSRTRDVEPTRRGMVKGKAGYMAPEQLLGSPVDRRSDVFSLGIVGYEATAQARAFRAGSDHETARRVVAGDVRPPAAARPGYPPDLAQVVLNALAVDPASRYQTAEEFGGAVERCATRLGLPLGPAAIAEEMQLLYPDAREPWVRARTPRGSSGHGTVDARAVPELAETLEPDDDATTARFVMLDAEAAADLSDP